MAAARVEPGRIQPAHVVAGRPGGCGGVPRRVQPRRRRAGDGAPACARRHLLLPRSNPGCKQSFAACFSYWREARQETLFFIKQIESLGNACGTIALIHAVGNAYPEISLLKNSSLDTFAKSSSGMTSYERAMFLEKDDDMARAHSVAASAGDTKLSDDVEEHYICFVECDGTLYELDGMKPGPIKHGSSSPESLLQDAVNIIKATMHNIPNSVKFNVMVLSRKAEQYGAIIPDN
ncbi:ubiquitin carboxyl-terminal hydrolase 3-like isoform X2 [Oryza brachyantha]|uniref:ubiquitin carboxyl-terminal hydrolase 3-like isoform X2 n=1 Tax=Oryza brachyantha TaxID=4533 RepID=UPI0007767D3E|nr:ubiquitin carboxyl-terminal hydrolase 3-like isoform X2 [Oryza brachyantha]